MSKGMLTFFCGKMGAGKTTKARALAENSNAVLLCEDEWLASLYPNQIKSIEAYVKYSNQLKPVVGPLVQSILASGTDVIMDFPANTISQREWFKSIFSEITAPHQLIYIEASDSVCLQQIATRRASQPERAATDTEAMFQEVTRYFVEPADHEGFNVIRESCNGQ